MQQIKNSGIQLLLSVRRKDKSEGKTKKRRTLTMKSSIRRKMTMKMDQKLL